MNEENSLGKSIVHQIGASLERLSVDELNLLLGELSQEKLRIEQEIKKKDNSRAAADSVFKM